MVHPLSCMSAECKFLRSYFTSEKIFKKVSNCREAAAGAGESFGRFFKIITCIFCDIPRSIKGEHPHLISVIECIFCVFRSSLKSVLNLNISSGAFTRSFSKNFLISSSCLPCKTSPTVFAAPRLFL